MTLRHSSNAYPLAVIAVLASLAGNARAGALLDIYARADISMLAKVGAGGSRGGSGPRAGERT